MADNYSILDSASASKTIAARENATGIYSPRVVSGGDLVFVQNEFTRPANTTAYAANYVVANSTSAATPLTIANCARFNGGGGRIWLASLITDQKSITPAFRVHVFNQTPTMSNDGANHRALYADISKRIGMITIPSMTTPADTTNSTLSRGDNFDVDLPFVCDAASRDLLFVIETLTAYTPASAAKYTLRLGILQY